MCKIKQIKRVALIFAVNDLFNSTPIPTSEST